MIDATNRMRLRRYPSLLLYPWKLTSFALGTGFFVWGAYFWDVPTWDVGVSILMSVACFLVAPWAVSGFRQALLRREGKWVWWSCLYLLAIYVVASGTYEVYNTIRMGAHPVTYWWNLAFSMPVTVVAGLVWSYDGTMRDLLRETSSALGKGIGGPRNSI
ncbi:MAG: hypothetical protein KC416_14485 [Myxococcales bacterium]|nr:hypothetical protein [Myxococcales bacterium]